MNLIVAVNSDWGIGCGGKLLVSIPDDMRFFRETTKGKVVVMGRKTLMSLPGGNPLKGRTNIVLTSDPGFSAGDAVICHSVEELLEEIKKYDADDVFVIGGQSVYEAMLPYCKTAYVTKFNADIESDRFFPDLDELKEWKITEESQEMYYNGIPYRYLTYSNVFKL